MNPSIGKRVSALTRNSDHLKRLSEQFPDLTTITRNAVTSGATRRRHTMRTLALIALPTLLPTAALAKYDPTAHGEFDYSSSVVISGGAGAVAGPLIWWALDGEKGWRWSKTDILLQLGFAGLAFVDAMQTVYFIEHGGHEANPFLGGHPSKQEIALGVGGLILGHVVVSAILPKPWRSVWQGAGIGVEIMATAHNHSRGIQLSVPW